MTPRRSGGTSSSRGGVTVHEVAVEPDTAALGAARAEFRRLLERVDVAPADVIDLLVIHSELLTNAIEQAPPDPVTVRAEIGTASVRLVVCNTVTGDHVPPSDQWGPGGVLDRRGRGLMIVDALCDRVDVDETEHTTCVSAFRTLTGGEPAAPA